MFNRITRIIAQPPPEQGAGDYWTVAWTHGRVAVTADVARAIITILDRLVTPRWVDFPDRSGSRVHIRTSLIRSVIEHTAEQRMKDRAFTRALDKEDEEEDERRPWDD